MDAHTHLRGTETGNAEARQFAPNPIGPRVAHEAIQFLLPWSLPTITGGPTGGGANFFTVFIASSSKLRYSRLLSSSTILVTLCFDEPTAA